MKSAPYPLKKALLASKFHPGSLEIVASLELRKGIPHVNRALSAPHHVIVQYVQGLAGVAESLEGGRKESSGSESPKTMATCQAGESGWQGLALSKPISLNKVTLSHLGHDEVGKRC